MMMRYVLLFVCALSICRAQGYTVETLAGTGAAGFSGDGSGGFRALLNGPSAVVLDNSGRLWLADRNNNRVRRIDTAGRISTVAVSEEPILDIAVDGRGTLYLSTATRIRAIQETGGESDVAGVITPGVLASEPSGSLLASDGTRVVRVDAPGTGNASVTVVSTLPAPVTSLTVAASGIYVLAGDAAYSINPTGTPTPLPGTGPVTAGARIAVDRWGDVYITGTRITKLIGAREYPLIGLAEPGDSGDNGPAVSARVSDPTGIAVDRAGNIFFADTGNHRIRLLRPSFRGTITPLTPPDNAVEIWPRNIVLRWNTFFNQTTWDVYFGSSPETLARAGTSTSGVYPLGRNLSDRTRYYWQIRTQFAPEPPIESTVFSFVTTTSASVPPPRPSAPAPGNNTVAQSVNPTFSWTGGGAAGYEFYIGENPSALIRTGVVLEPRINFNNVVTSGILLRPETTYYWQVVAFNDVGAAPSPIWTFTTGPIFGYPWSVQTIAGAPQPVADGNAATATVLSFPRQPVADAAGNIYFLNGDRTIRRIATDGRISTTFTLTTGPLAAIAADPVNGQLWFAAPEFLYRIELRSGQRIYVAGQVSRRGYAGDGGPGAQALFDGITSIAASRTGTLFVADTRNNRVRAITNGSVRAVAGNGTCTNTDDSGAAASTAICAPSYLAVDNDENVYVYGGGYLFRITTSGTVQRIAGTGAVGYTGDGGPATEASIGPVSGIAVDASGSVYLADAAANTIRVIDAAGSISTYAGDRSLPGGFADETSLTSARFWSIAGLGFDEAGNLLIGDTRNFRIRRVDPSGVVRTIAGTDTARGDRGNATSALLYGPADVAVDNGGNTYIADSLNNRIRRVTINGSIDTVAGGGSNLISAPDVVGRDARDYQLDLADGASVAVNERGNLVFNTGTGPELAVNGQRSDAVLSMLPNSIVASFALARIGRVGGITRGRLGEIYVSDTANHQILRIGPDGNVSVIAGTGSPGFAGDGGAAAVAQLNSPRSLALSPDGDVFVAETGRIRRVSGSGRISTVAFENATGLAFDTNGVLYVTTGRSIAVTVQDPRFPDTLSLLRIAGDQNGAAPTSEVLALNARLGELRGLATTPSGELVFADYSENAVRRLVRNVPSAVSIVSGNNQALNSEFRLPEPLQVRVLGRSGLPIPGVNVRFTYTSGSGSQAFLADVTTDTSGVATAYIYLNDSGSNLRIYAAPFGVAPVQFTITGRAAQ